jgi:hypothetical protein
MMISVRQTRCGEASETRFLRETGSLTVKARDNPFRVERVRAFRYRPLESSWDELLRRVERANYRGALVGPEGSGKTTLLEDIAERLAALGQSSRWLQIRRETRRNGARLVKEVLRSASAEDVLLVDGVEQLGPLTWRRLRRGSLSHAGLIITTHAPGRLPTLVECRTNVELLKEIVLELAPGEYERLRPELPALFARHWGNVRLCLRELYDWYATAPVVRLPNCHHG